jgi:hypothetical protein
MDSNNPKPKMPWQEEFNIINRRPRTGMDKIRVLLEDAWPPEIELREDKKKKRTEIVVSFPVTSNRLSARLRKIYLGQGMPLKQAFQQALRLVPEQQQRILRTQLATLGYNVYRETWLYLFQILYLDMFHPTANRHLRQEFDNLKQATRRKAGRGTGSPIDEANLKQRYEDLLSKCKLVHDAVRKVIADLQHSIPTPRRAKAEIRPAVFEEVRKALYGTLACHLIFSGKAFQIMIKEHGKPEPPRLEMPQEWSPENLAVAVLALEENKKYRVILKKIAAILRKSQEPR